MEDQEPQVSIAHDQVEFSVDERYRRIVEQMPVGGDDAAVEPPEPT